MLFRTVQIGIDDLCPRPGHLDEHLDNLDSLLSIEGIKVDFFVPFGFIRGEDGPYYLRDYPDFVNRLRSLQNKYPGQIRYNIHGMHHRTNAANPNDEFLHSSPEDLRKRLGSIDKMIDQDKELWVYDGKKGFRPPGWKIAQWGVDALIDHGYTHISLLRPKRSQFYGHLNFGPMKVHWCNCAPPHHEVWGEDDLSITYHFMPRGSNILQAADCVKLNHVLGQSENKFYFLTEL